MSNTTVHHTPTHSHAMRFPSVGLEVLSAVIHLFGVSVLAFLLAKKVHWGDVSSFQALSRIAWPRLLVILNVIDSWLFLFSTGLLVNGTGMELSETVCFLGILNCIIFYATSKILIYLFLVEKVYVVWSGAARKKRLRSPIYMTCLSVVAVYMGVAIFLILGRISYFRDDGSCVIGLTRPASLTLLIYDLFVNVFLTSLFVWPLLNRKFNTPRIRRVAIRTLWAAAVALTTSCINILVLTIMHGKQLGWVCLASCGTDVVINAGVLCWVTSGQSSQSGGSSSSRDSTSKELEDNIIDCSDVSRQESHTRRRRARSEPPRPTPQGRMGKLGGTLTRLFESRRPAATYASSSLVLDRDVESSAETSVKGEGGDKAAGVVEGMYEHVSATAPDGPLLLSQPIQVYKSMLKRSNQSLRQHLNDSQVQIHVTEETTIIMDDIPPVRTKRKHRKHHGANHTHTETDDASKDCKS
ncbi:hypothetical protein GY45DRAFT_1304273 [Cubamyces sp. BRFM 1775]|nr:hypothetical protein GY45DRAFT_1304273 [Cubamyces sp. BRFM 1775]